MARKRSTKTSGATGVAGVYQAKDKSGNPIPGSWRLKVPAGLSPTGKPTNFAFKTPSEAARYRRHLEESKAALGKQGQSLSPSQLRMAVEIFSKAKEAGIAESEILEAVYIGARSILDRRSVPTVQDAATSFMEGKRTGAANPYRRQLTPRHLSELQSSVDDFVEDFQTSSMADLTRKAVLTHLETRAPSPSSFNLRHAHVRSFLNHSVQQGWLQENLLTQLDKHRAAASKDFVAPEQLRALFSACRDLRRESYLDGRYRVDASKAMPALALQAFGGLRASEVRKLDWGCVDLERGEVLIGEGISKTGSMRVVEVNPTLHAWLSLVPLHDRSGLVVQYNWPTVHGAVRRTAGVDGMRNPLRTAYGVYSRASGVPIPKIAQQMGHAGEAVTAKFYANTIVSSAQAAAYWNVLPEGVKAGDLLVSTG